MTGATRDEDDLASLHRDTDPSRPKQRVTQSDGEIECFLNGMVAIAKELKERSGMLDEGDLNRLPLDQQIELLSQSIDGNEETRVALEYGKVSRAMFFQHFFDAGDDFAKRSLDYLLLSTFGAGLLMGRREARSSSSALVAAEELRRKRLKDATTAASARGDPIRQAALADIRTNPKTTQTACARRVAAALGKDQRAVEKIIARLFEWRDLPGGGREKRPIVSGGAPASAGLTG